VIRQIAEGKSEKSISNIKVEHCQPILDAPQTGNADDVQHRSDII
jgi:hypothetical protein